MNFAGKVHDVADMQRLARQCLPKGLYEFIERGTESDIAIRENIAAFDRIKLTPTVLRDVSSLSTKAMLLGKEHAMPVAIAPTGAAGITHFRGEVALARAAAAANIPFSLATRSMSSIEDIASEAGGTLWLQLYPPKDRKLSDMVLERADKTGFDALIVTVDTPIPPHRAYNNRNGFTVSFKLQRRSLFDMLQHPRWLGGVIGRYVLAGGFPRFENLPGRPSIRGNSGSPADILDGSITWDVVKELRRRWPRKFILKGIMTPADARLAVDAGADAIIVSNHGGRNLDMSPAPIDVVSDIAEAVGDRAKILLDSGIRRGSDIAKALVLGASGVLVGRATLYGVAVGGEAGAKHVLDLLGFELRNAMGLLGCNNVDQLTRDVLYPTRRLSA